MIRKVKELIDIPLIVGGGIRDAETAEAILAAGADIIVTGNLLQKTGGEEMMKKIGKAVKGFGRK
jgi:phosphoglycerol geranylgeranyltransferase